jgi:glycosyltransferase involved in cell wall biosynthesis
MKIALLTRSLDRGGAERQLCLLAGTLRQRGHDVKVLTFYPGGALASDLAACGVTRIALEKRGRWDLLGFFLRLLAWLRQERPDLLYSFMPTANLTATAAKLILPWLRIVWGIRAAGLDLRSYDLLSGMTYRLELALRHRADAIIANSSAGLRPFLSRGYPAQKAAMIPNGIDANRFSRDIDGRKRLRQEWNIGDDQLLIGIVARIDPQKDHATFLQAAQMVARQQAHARFAIIGAGPAELQASLRAMAVELGLADRLLWLPARDDMPAVYSALDCLVLSSAFGEGFPNVLAEAQACETACVATDVGESRLALGNPDRLAPPRHPAALAAAILATLTEEAADSSLGMARRRRMERDFSVASLADRTMAVFATLGR